MWKVPDSERSGLVAPGVAEELAYGQTSAEINVKTKNFLNQVYN